MADLTFTSLPHDILIHICIQLDSKDFLNLLQTCRVLHAFAHSDYVWHNLNHRLPMDMSSSRDGKLGSIPAVELHMMTRTVLRLHENWQRQTHVSAITKVRIPHMALSMQPLGSKWLVTSHRARNNFICIWRLATDVPASCMIEIESQKAFAFEAAFREEGGNIAIVSVLGASPTDGGKGQLTIYQIDLKGHQTNQHSLGIPFLMNTHEIELGVVFYCTQISGAIVAAATMNLASQPLHQIVLFNIDTKSTVIVDCPELSEFDASRMQFKLYPPFIVIVGVHRKKIKVLVRQLPGKIFSRCAGGVTSTEDWDASIIDYYTECIRDVDIYLSPEPIYLTPLTSFAMMATGSPESSSTDYGTTNIYRFPVDISVRNVVVTNWRPTFCFKTPSHATLDPVCFGKAGLRAVWLMHQWDLDGYQLMRGSFSDEPNGKLVITPLTPTHFALPFEPHTCQSLYFEESTGKVWIAVHTGDIFVLHF